jgi:TonB-dependent receptor
MEDVRRARIYPSEPALTPTNGVLLSMFHAIVLSRALTGRGALARLSVPALLACSASLVWATPACAQQRSFNIPAQPLAAAIAALGRQAHLQIVAPADGIETLRNRPIQGVQDARAALRALIAGTGLEIHSDDGARIVLRMAGPPPARGAAPPTEHPAALSDAPAPGSPIVVTGYRASMAKADEIKRRADGIEDVIVAEDINQLPDNSATEALARLPGVQIFRNRGEGQSITIRGTSSVVTTLNGQEAYTGASRRTLLNSYPASLIASMTIYKALTPDLIEGGLGGEVDVQLHHPLDFPVGLTVAGSARTTYDDRAKKAFYNGDLLLSRRWDSATLGQIGVMIDASYTRRDYLEAYRENYTPETSTASATAGVQMPSAMLIKHIEGYYTRPVITGEIQWRPARNFGMHLRATHVTDDNTYLDNDFQTNIAANTVLGNVSLVPGTNILKSASFTATASSGPRADYTHQLLDTTQIEYGADWSSGIAKLSTSAVYTLSRINTDTDLFLLAFNKAPTVSANFQSDSRYGGLGYGYTNGVDVSDINNFHVRAYSDERTRQTGNGLQWRTDLTLATGNGFFRSIKTGFRFTDRRTRYQDGTDLANLDSLKLPMSSFPGGANAINVPSGFAGDDVSIPASWANYNTALLGDVGNRAALNAYVRSLPGMGALFADNGRAAYNPVNGFSGHENTYAFYGEVKYGLDLLGIPIDGIIGARVINTQLHITGTEYSATKQPSTGSAIVYAYTPINGHQNYLDVDPTVTAVLHFMPKLQLRLAWTKTLTRPDFSQLNPSVTLAQVTAASGAYNGTATASGNPDLQPTRSTNWDASLEYYFGRAGQASVALFDRELNGYITSAIMQQTLPGGNGVASVTLPINAGKGYIRGLELEASTFFDGAPGPLRNMGASANLTLLDTQQQLPSFTGATAGISKTSYNASLFYDDGRFRGRVAWGWRGGFPLSYNLSDPAHNLIWYPISRLDAQLTWRVNRNVALTLDATNLLDPPQRSYWGTKDFADRVYYEGRTYSAALRFKF